MSAPATGNAGAAPLAVQDAATELADLCGVLDLAISGLSPDHLAARGPTYNGLRRLSMDALKLAEEIKAAVHGRPAPEGKPT